MIRNKSKGQLEANGTDANQFKRLVSKPKSFKTINFKESKQAY